MERNHKINIRESLLNNKQKQAPNKILRGHVPQSTSDYPNRQPPGGIVDGRNEEGVTKVGGALPRDLLDDGQGKCEAGTSDMEISTNSDGSASPPVERTSNQKLLLPPVIEATGLRATVVTTDIQRKQNKQQGMVHLEQQRPASQWNIHQGHTLLREDHWVEVRNTANAAQMAPQGLALHHEAAGVLAEWETMGCPTCTGCDWTLAEIQAAIDRGPHRSALEPDALCHFTDKVQVKVAKGQARVVLWVDIKGNHPQQLKVSPVAAIPHKSRAYRLILDLLSLL
jgi:hypothetical protein